eukprot:gene10699-22338_t
MNTQTIIEVARVHRITSPIDSLHAKPVIFSHSFLHKVRSTLKKNIVEVETPQRQESSRIKAVPDVFEKTVQDCLKKSQPTQSQSRVKPVLDVPLVSQLRNIKDQIEFVKVLKNAAQKKVILSSNDRHNLALQLQERCQNMSVSSISTIVWSLGTLKLPTRNKDVATVCDLLLERLYINRYKITSEEMSMSLLGLARLGVRLPSTTTGSFLEVVPRVFPRMDGQQVANSIWALGKIGVEWESLSPDMRRAVSRAAVHNLGVMSPQGVSNTIHGMSNMRGKWTTLSPHFVEATTLAIKRCVGSMKEQEVSNCLSGLGRLGADWASLPLAVQSSLADAFYRVLSELGPKGLAMS